jgi:hypothetical protein
VTPEDRALAETVAATAYRHPDDTTPRSTAQKGTVHEAVEVIDAAITVVNRRRRLSRNVEPDLDLDDRLLTPWTLTDLVEFLRHTRHGVLTRHEIAEEAGLWRDLLRLAWPQAAQDASAINRAIEVLASLPDAGPEPLPVIPVEPVNELERAMARAAGDDTARPALWQALHDGEVVLPVVAYELIRPEGANFQFLSAPLEQAPLVLGFAAEDRFDALLPGGSPVSRVVPLGRTLPRFWPEGHWLMLNPTYANQVVLSPWEIAGLPHGSRSELPHPRAVQVEPADEHDRRLYVLADALAGLPRIDHVHWARVRPRRGAAAAAWQDVLVATAKATGDGPPDEAAEAAEAAAVQALSAALPPDLFPRAIVLGRQSDLAHPFVEAVVATAHRIRAKPSMRHVKEG